MSYFDVIQEIEKLPHYREFVCSACGYKQRVLVLIIDCKCEKCGENLKLRGYAPIGTEIEDVIDAVLEWIGKGTTLNDVMEWKNIRDSFPIDGTNE